MAEQTNTSSNDETWAHKVVKTLVIILLFPIIIGFAKGLILEVAQLKSFFSQSLYWGVASYLLFHIFISEPIKFYKNTQKFIQVIFSFFSPLFRLSYYILPFWSLMVMVGYFVVCKVFGLEEAKFLFFFLSGFTFTLHVVMVAKILKTDELKKIIDYLFIIFLMIIINIFFISLNLKLYDPSFSIQSVAQSGMDLTYNIYKDTVSHLLFP